MKSEEKDLLKKIDKTNLPQHVAIIMDGNGRWSEKRGLPRIFGHRAGIKSVRAVVSASRFLGIKYLSLYAFSTENWQRPKTEIKALMRLLYQYLHIETENLKKNNIRVIISGNTSAFSEKVQKEINRACRYTQDCKGLTLNLCLNYGSRQELVLAVNKILSSGRESIDENTLSKFLYTSELPDPDLFIRTSGELRLSNFFLWQVAYTELYFTPCLWPDFNKIEFYKSIIDYQKRERRFGRL